MALGELVSFPNRDGLRLDGILFLANNSKAFIIHLHGSCGNFYQGDFVKKSADVYLNNSISYLSFNVSAHDLIAEGCYQNGGFEYVGGSVREFASSNADIAAAIVFAQKYSSRIVLQGHSQGCDRILQYLLSTGETHESVLLCIADSYELQNNWLKGETVEEQVTRLSQIPKVSFKCDAIYLLPAQEYGLNQQSGFDYSIPITNRALLSIIQGVSFNFTSLFKDNAYRLDSKALFVWGDRDTLQVHSLNEMEIFFKKRFVNFTSQIIGNCDHMMTGFEETVARTVVGWIDK